MESAVSSIERSKSRSAGVWLAGPIASMLFAASLLGFAAARTDGYSHATKAVSELGAIGAPMGTAFNLVGLIFPGFLIAAFGIAIAQTSGRRVGPWLLAASGALLAVAGVFPVNMAAMQSGTSVGHVVGAMGSGFCFAAALFWLGPVMARSFEFRVWGRLTPWFSLFLVANIGWQAAYQATGIVYPGWGQRIGFLGYFLWVSFTGVLLWQKARNADLNGPADAMSQPGASAKAKPARAR